MSLGDLKTKVDAEAGVIASAVLLLSNLAAEVRAHAGDPAKMQAIADELDADKASLAAAVAANAVNPPATGGGSSPFVPANPTALDIYIAVTPYHFVITGKWIGQVFNIINTVPGVQAQIQVDDLSFWKDEGPVADGGETFSEVHASGTTPTLYFCAQALEQYSESGTTPPPVDGGGTTPPPSGPTGEADLSSTPVVAAASPIASDPNITVLTFGKSDIYYNGHMVPALPANGDRTKTVNLGPYTLSQRDGSVVDVPAHWCRAAYVDDTLEPLTVVNSPSVLTKNNWAFTYGDVGIPVSAQGSTVPYTPMGSSDITVYIPTTGERPDIGLVTNNDAYFLMGGSPDAMFAWHKSGFSIPDKFVDDTTWLPVDLTKYPSANHYYSLGAQGSPDMADGPGSAGGAGAGGWAPQQAHFPQLWYIAYRATGKVSALWQGQQRANFMLIDDAYNSGQVGKAVWCGEQRGLGWTLRELFSTHAATRDYEASGGKTGAGTYLQPASYYQTLLDQTRVFIGSYLSDKTNIFNLLGADMSSPAGPWQQEYVVSALAFGILTGHSEWADTFLFALGNTIARTNGTSGWPPAYCGYYLNYKLATWAAVFQDLTVNGNGAGTITQAQVDSLVADPMNGGICIGTTEYMMTTRAVLAMAITLDNKGLCAVRKAYPALDTCYANAHKLAASIGYMNPRQSVLAAAA